LVKANIELNNQLATLKSISAPMVPQPTIKAEKPLSISPQGLTVRGSHWKFTIPITLLASIIPLAISLVNDYSQMKRDFKLQTDTFARTSARIEEVNTYAHEVAKSNEELREKVAELSGYLAGVLPKAGVKVPGTENGGTYVNVVSDPLPPGELKKRGKPIVVHTPVPAPSPKD
jgi:hypothetical protein